MKLRLPRPAAADAGWFVALLCALLAAEAPSGGGTALPGCAAPREQHAEQGHTWSVDCEGQGGALRGPARLLFGMGLDPNRADSWALEAVPGIGPARAAAIVAGRGAGPYRSLADLGRVHGIGPVTLRQSAGWWSFEAGPAPLSRSR